MFLNLCVRSLLFVVSFSVFVLHGMDPDERQKKEDIRGMLLCHTDRDPAQEDMLAVLNEELGPIQDTLSEEKIKALKARAEFLDFIDEEDRSIQQEKELEDIKHTLWLRFGNSHVFKKRHDEEESVQMQRKKLNFAACVIAAIPNPANEAIEKGIGISPSYTMPSFMRKDFQVMGDQMITRQQELAAQLAHAQKLRLEFLSENYE